MPGSTPEFGPYIDQIIIKQFERFSEDTMLWTIKRLNEVDTTRSPLRWKHDGTLFREPYNKSTQSSSPKLTPTPSSSEPSTLSPVNDRYTTISSTEEQQSRVPFPATGKPGSSKSRKRQAHEDYEDYEDYESEFQTKRKRMRTSSDDPIQLRPQKRIFYNYSQRSSRNPDKPTKPTRKLPSKKVLEVQQNGRRMKRKYDET